MATLRRRFGNIFSPNSSSTSAVPKTSISPPQGLSNQPNDSEEKTIPKKDGKRDKKSSSGSSSSRNRGGGSGSEGGGRRAVLTAVISGEDVVVLPKRRSKRRNGLIFGLGGIFGIFVALFFANHNEVISLDALMDLNLDSLIDVIPAGILRDASEFSV